MLEHRKVLLPMISGSAILGLYFLYRRQKKKPRVVGHVDELMIFPVVSCQGTSVKNAMALDLGLQSDDGMTDRYFICRNAGDNERIGAGQCSKLLQIQVSVSRGKIYSLTAPGMEELKIDLDELRDEVMTVMYGKEVQSLDAGDEAAKWITKFTGKDARISANPMGRKVKEHNWGISRNNFDGVNWRLGSVKKFEEFVSFAPHYPFNLLGVDSVRDIQERIPNKNITHLNFRSNIIAKALNGEPWDEDNWLGELHIGHAVFSIASVSSRCTITTMNPKTGERDKDNEPLRTLRKIRLPKPRDERIIRQEGISNRQNKPICAMDMVLLKSGKLSVGDEIILYPQ